MYTTLAQAKQALEDASEDVLADFQGENSTRDEVLDSCWYDLVAMVAFECDAETAKELHRTEGC